MHDQARSTDRVLFHVVEMCCLSETLTGVYLTEMLARTTDVVARAAVESLLEDEIDPGRVGWAYLAERARERRIEGLSEVLPAMLDRTFRSVLDATKSAKEPDDAKLETVGHLGVHASGDVYARTLRDVIFPGFEALNVDLGPSRTLADDLGWLQR